MKKQKKGFSITFTEPDSIETKYTVYFQRRNYKVVYCYIISDNGTPTFKGKAVCHNQDNFSLKKGMQLSYLQAKKKRAYYYFTLYENLTNQFERQEMQITSVDYKLNKFLQGVEE